VQANRRGVPEADSDAAVGGMYCNVVRHCLQVRGPPHAPRKVVQPKDTVQSGSEDALIVAEERETVPICTTAYC
jgi:hypothetical protein